MALGYKNIDNDMVEFRRVLEDKMYQEIERKSALFGPHRDDLIISINGKAAKSFASQGQQRTLVLCLKLAEMEIILKENGNYPILLLDDVLSALDEYRREYLINDIAANNKQTIITMTEAENRILNMKTAVYKVQHGNIRREQ